MKEGVTMCVGGGGGGSGGGAPVSRKVNGHHIESAEVVQCVFRAAGMVHLRNMSLISIGLVRAWALGRVRFLLLRET